jgi:hypothetical protein
MIKYIDNFVSSYVLSEFRSKVTDVRRQLERLLKDATNL